MSGVGGVFLRILENNRCWKFNPNLLFGMYVCMYE